MVRVLKDRFERSLKMSHTRFKERPDSEGTERTVSNISLVYGMSFKERPDGEGTESSFVVLPANR